MTFRIIFAVLAAAASPAFAQSVPPAPPAVAPAPVEDLVRVALDTSAGRIVLALDRGRAPITTANFLAYVDKQWLDGQPFYRAMPYGDGGLIQGGVRDGAKQLPPIAIETTEPSCSASTKRRSPGRPARNGTSVEPGLEKIVVSSSRRRTSNVASRTVVTAANCIHANVQALRRTGI